MALAASARADGYAGCASLSVESAHMDWETLRGYLNSKPASTEETPFGPESMIYKVSGKIFAVVSWMESPLRISLKCDPDEAMGLRSTYPAITTAPYFNKRHWNSAVLNGTLPDDLVRELIDESYDLVVLGLPKSSRPGGPQDPLGRLRAPTSPKREGL